jgi:hypothetical protein
MEKYTEREVEQLIKTTVIETINSTLDWIKDETVIVDKDTQKKIENSEITISENSKKLTSYICKRLEMKGIVFIFEE